jgi:hypothetical protein
MKIGFGGLIGVMAVTGALAGCSSGTQADASTKQASSSSHATSSAPAKDSHASVGTAVSTPPAPKLTAGQSNALRSAKQYLNTMAFSKAGLIEQLSSSFGSGYSRADATYAVNHVGADWNEQAARAAKQYLQTMPFSRSALIQQLESSFGAKFTHAQAVYGVNAAGL